MKKSKKVLLSALSLCFVASTATAIMSTAPASANDTLATRLTTKEYLDENFFIDGTSVRVADATHTPGKRHHVVLSNALYEELCALDNVQVGIALIPEQLLTDGSLDIADAQANFDGVVYDTANAKDCFGEWKKDASKVEGVVSLTNIPDTDFDVNIVSRGFIKIGNDYYYTSQPTARSMSWVARQEFENVNTLLTPDQITSLKDTYLDLDYTVSFNGGATQSVIYGDNLANIAPSVNVDDGYVLKGWYNQSKTYKWDMENGYVVGNTNLYSVQMQDTFVEDFAESYSKSKNFASANRANVNATATWEENVEGKSGVLASKGETEDNETKIYLSSEYTLADLQTKFDSYDWGGLTINAYIGAQGNYTVNFGLNEEGNALTQTVAGQEWVELKITRNTAKNKGLENTLAVDGTGADALFAVEDLPEDTLVYIDSISFSETPTTTPAKGVVQSFDGYSAGIRKISDVKREDTNTVEYLDEWDGRYGVARDIGADKYANFYMGANVSYQDFVDTYGLAYDESTQTYDMKDLKYISVWIWIEKLDGQADTLTLQNGKVTWKNVPRETWYELKFEKEKFLLAGEATNTSGKYGYTLQDFCYTLSYDTVSKGTKYLFFSDGLVEGTYPNTSANTLVYFDEIKFVMYDTSPTIQSFDDKATSLRRYGNGALTAQETAVYKDTWDGRNGVVGDYSYAGDAYGNFYVSSYNTYEELLYKSENLDWDYISTWIWIDEAGTFTLVSGKLKYSVVGQKWQELRFYKDDFCVSANNENGKLRTTLNNFLSGISSERQGNEYIFYCDALKNSNQVYVYFDDMSFVKQTANAVIQDFSATSKPTIITKSYTEKNDTATVEYLDSLTDANGTTRYGVAGDYGTGSAGNFYIASTQTYQDLKYSSDNLNWDYISIWILVDTDGVTLADADKVRIYNKNMSSIKVNKENVWTEIKFTKENFASNKMAYDLDGFLKAISSTQGSCEYLFFSTQIMQLKEGSTSEYEGKYKIYFDEISFHVVES